MDTKTAIKDMINSIINDDTDTATSSLHSVVQDKMRSVIYPEKQAEVIVDDEDSGE